MEVGDTITPKRYRKMQNCNNCVMRSGFKWGLIVNGKFHR